ncbi:protein TANC2-like [Xenia sp. Carnegie-2017]|uniref:protein TANC2-like n=1 Tax=Xenia sp. Carnegie-2017 TaxID=2897299 RepID=UPI001F046CA7|nr:protein TANC2-like [Xenia sp. Carnegie-2017]
MASAPKKLKIEANGSRLSKLLINKGTNALTKTLQIIINLQSSNLKDKLKDPSTKSKLTSLKFKVINKEQWNLLYPSTGSPDIQNFDISLLTVLLRNICGLTAPHSGWNNLPSSSDSSISANIARIKFYRNKVYGHITTTSVNDSEFEHLWQEISKSLVALGIQQAEIDELKKAPLSPDEANHIEILKNWYEKEKQLIDVTEETKEVVKELKKDFEVMKNKVEEIKENMPTKADIEMIQDKICSDLQKLGNCNFNGLIKDLNKKYLEGTRQWLFEKVDNWFTDKNEDVSNVMILIAGPGVGKSVFAAEVCRRYSEKKKLAASHFCRYNRSDERNPRMLIESLACSMCDTISDFKCKLNEELQRKHSYESLTDAFRVLLNNPLHSLEHQEPMLLVIDALDESQVDGKSELLELIAEEFDRLPKWIKIFITSRPELPVQKELKDVNPVEITTLLRDENNEEDLHKYLRHQLNNRLQKDCYLLQSLVKKCEGSFLYAYYAQLSLKEENIELTYENIQQLVPSGLSGVYAKQFKKVKELLTKKSPRNSVISETTFMQFLELLAACREFLPLTLLFSYLGFSDDITFEVRSKIIELLSQILPVYDDYLTVYHKSLFDWLKSDGYEQHEFTVNPKNGHKLLWHACEKVFKHIKSINIFKDQMNTAIIKYALKNGIYHMSKCCENVDFSWAVDVKVVYARLMCGRTLT